MMSRLTFKLANGRSILIILYVLFVSPHIANATQDKIVVPAAAQKAHEVEIYDSYAAYMEEDKALNNSYKTLSNSLDKKSRTILKQSQKTWIKWRDVTCYSAQDKVNRQLGAFGSSMRNDCLLTLTEQRNIEFLQFMKSPQEAEKKKFDFDRKNEYIDDE